MIDEELKKMINNYWLELICIAVCIVGCIVFMQGIFISNTYCIENCNLCTECKIVDTFEKKSKVHKNLGFINICSQFIIMLKPMFNYSSLKEKIMNTKYEMIEIKREHPNMYIECCLDKVKGEAELCQKI